MTSPNQIGSFLQWMTANKGSEDAWLILGKGPSFSQLPEYDIAPFKTLSLNHVVRDLPVDVAHIVDVNVVKACGAALLSNCKVLVMPWHPHEDDPKEVHRTPANPKTLDWFADQDPTLGALREQGRLLTYNLVTGRFFEPFPGEPTILLYFFGFEAAFNLLAEAGVKKIRTLGVDGGRQYSELFADLREKTLLINGVDDFDRQFHPIAQNRFSKGIDFCPLNEPDPVRVFVAATDSEMLPVKVLEYSILRNASRNTEVMPIMAGGVAIPASPKAQSLAATPFSFQRFLIPELCGYRGKAIYMDSDMVVFKDIRQVWNTPLHDQQILTVAYEATSHRRPQFSVMLLDCESLDWDIANIVTQLETEQLTYKELMGEMKLASRIEQRLPSHWNHLEHYVPRVTGLLHYTDQHTQPWISIKNVLGWVWVRELFSAIDAGFMARSMVEQAVAAGYVRPSLLWQIDAREENPLLIPRRVLEGDKDFVPPYLGLAAHAGGLRIHQRSRRDTLNAFKARTERVKLRLKRKLNDLLDRPPPSPFH